MFAMFEGAVDEARLVDVGTWLERNRRFCAARVTALLACMEL